jgi:hypothetical protein
MPTTRVTAKSPSPSRSATPAAYRPPRPRHPAPYKAGINSRERGATRDFWRASRAGSSPLASDSRLAQRERDADTWRVLDLFWVQLARSACAPLQDAHIRHLSVGLVVVGTFSLEREALARSGRHASSGWVERQRLALLSARKRAMTTRGSAGDRGVDRRSQQRSRERPRYRVTAAPSRGSTRPRAEGSRRGRLAVAASLTSHAGGFSRPGGDRLRATRAGSVWARRCVSTCCGRRGRPTWRFGIRNAVCSSYDHVPSGCAVTCTRKLTV